MAERTSLFDAAQVEYEMYLLRFFAGESVMEKVRDHLARRGLEPHTLTTNVSAYERKLPWAKG